MLTIVYVISDYNLLISSMEELDDYRLRRYLVVDMALGVLRKTLGIILELTELRLEEGLYSDRTEKRLRASSN